MNGPTTHFGVMGRVERVWPWCVSGFVGVALAANSLTDIARHAAEHVGQPLAVLAWLLIDLTQTVALTCWVAYLTEQWQATRRLPAEDARLRAEEAAAGLLPGLIRKVYRP